VRAKSRFMWSISLNAKVSDSLCVTLSTEKNLLRKSLMPLLANWKQS